MQRIRYIGVAHRLKVVQRFRPELGTSDVHVSWLCSSLSARPAPPRALHFASRVPMHAAFVRALPLVLRRSRSRPAPSAASTAVSLGARASAPIGASRRRRAPSASAVVSAAPGRRALLFAAASVFVTLAPRSASAAAASGASPFAPAAPDPSSCAPVRPDVRAFSTMSDAPLPDADADAILERYPGTAVERMENARARASLTEAQLSGDWEDVRGLLLWAAGLRDLRDVAPGEGNTSHCFNDFNHVDATTMTLDVSDNENRGKVQGIAFGNRLGPGIRVASDPELGPGGTWCTCCQGGAAEPPADVAHVQFRSAIAWKLVWVPAGGFTRFVLVDDAGKQLATGLPTGRVPAMREREYNYRVLRGGRYAEAADAYGAP